MASQSEQNQARPRGFTWLLWATVFCWVAMAFVHLYFFSYPSMDSWCYAAPACTAKAPFVLRTPFLGTFQGADRGWGLHWPGGPLFVSIFTPFLPHSPLTLVLIYLSFWLLLSLATYALVFRLTFSWWLALAALILVAADRNSFSVTWLQRYELLDGAVAIAALLAICGPQDRYRGLRSAAIAGAFFFFPLVHPVFSGLGGTWLAYLGCRTMVLRRPWKHFFLAAAGYLAGWLCFIAYYCSRPWLYAVFRNHAHVGFQLTHDTAPPGIHTFALHLINSDQPTRAGALIYTIAIGGALYLLFEFWKSREAWKTFLAEEDLLIFTTLGFLCDLFLSQSTYNTYYWTSAWPFATAVFCVLAARLLRRLPRRRNLIAGVIVVLLLLHSAFWAGRTYLWYKAGFADMRSQLSRFAAALPPTGQLFLPEVLWDNFTRTQRTVYINSVPYNIGQEGQKEYSAYVNPKVRSGDVLVIDALQSHPPVINPLGPGWKVLEHCAVTYVGDKVHGFDMTAYQKQ